MSNGDRLGRIEEALDQLRQRQETSQQQIDELRQRQETSQQQIDELRQRQEETQAQLDRQIPVMAELRASTADLRVTAEALLQTVQIHQQNFERLIVEFQHHRSDGHGA